MKDLQEAQRLLYALSDVKEEFIAEAAQWESAPRQRRGRTARFPAAVRMVAAAAACIALVLAGISTLKWNAPSAPERPVDLACNPIEEVRTMSEAESLLGFGLRYDRTETSFIEQSILVYNGSILEVNLALRNKGDAQYCIRKGRGAEDVSGDYTEYAVVQDVPLADCDVVLKGDDRGWQLATWHRDGYSYSISAQERAMSTDEIRRIVSGID